MLLKEFIERTRMVDLGVFPKDRLSDLLHHFEQGDTLADLDGQWTDILVKVPVTHLQRLGAAAQAWRERQSAFEKLKDSLRTSQLPEPPGRAAKKAMVPHKVWALGRALKMCVREDFDDEEAWADALGAHIDAWSGSVNLALRRSELRCILDTSHPMASDFELYARRREPLSDLAGHRWMAIRRGEKAGALQVSFNWPRSSIDSMIDSMRSRMGPAASEREVGAVAEELVWNDLPTTIRALLDRRVEDEAIRSAVSLYGDLLRSAPLCDPPVGAVSVGAKDRTIGVVVVDGEGRPETSSKVDPRGDGEAAKEVLGALAGHDIECVVVPATAPDTERLTELRKSLAESYQVVPVRSAALREAREQVEEGQEGLAPEIASAMVLARRALDPGREWARIDPVSIGLAEYQKDLDERRLRESMLEALGLYRLELKKEGGVKRRKTKPRAGRRKKAARTPRLRPNPLVRSISDLRPGMTVTGLVSNITRFGVFVNLGLEEEGMIHISELSAQFVSSPEEVVTLGQQITARVLDVDAGKKRVALTLKKEDNRRMNVRENRRSRPRPSVNRPQRSSHSQRRGGGSNRNASPSRTEALRQLEDLFKK